MQTAVTPGAMAQILSAVEPDASSGAAAAAASREAVRLASAPPADPAAESASDATAASPGPDAAAPAIMIPAPLVPHVQADQMQGQRGRVLNDMQAAVVAFAIGANKYARALLVDAYEQIEIIYANSASAAAARSKFVPEANKDYKGEPYERAMVGYYLGLTDMIQGDMDNAQASFRWGEYQDTMSASESYQNDMAALMFLRGWVNQCTDNHVTAAEDFRLAQSARPTLPIPPKEHNLLLIAEVGSAPVKWSSGQYQEELRYKPGDEGSAPPAITFNVASATTQAGAATTKGSKPKYGLSTAEAELAEDLYWQATTLGGRAVDKILAGKAAFKEGAQTTANVAGAVAQVSTNMAMLSALSGDRNSANAFAGLGMASAFLSLGAQMASAAARPAADTRYWSNLPGKLMFATLQVAGDVSDAAVTINQPGGRTIGKGMSVFRTGNNCQLAWVRDTNVAPAWVAASPSAWVALDDVLTGGAGSAAGTAAAGRFGGSMMAPAASRPPPPTIKPSSAVIGSF